MDDFECQGENFGIYFLGNEKNLKDFRHIKGFIGSGLSEVEYDKNLLLNV